jgi:3',5'-nucleoside bisphosphate phosphatase
MPSDLHMHTTFSDGKMTPEELVSAAKKAGLSYIAITDHDTVGGIQHLYEAGLYPVKGIRIVPGIELSARDALHEVHILGYNIDIFDRDLEEKLDDIVEGRWRRFSQMIEKLRQLGYAITEADVLKIAGTSKSISRSHIARALVSKGIFPSIREAFSEVLDKGKSAYVSHYNLSVIEIVSLIKEAGGSPVLAHPKLIRDDSFVEELLHLGIEGIEVFYPQHDKEDTEKYRKMAEKYQLAITGGSDFHGLASRYPQQLGTFVIDDKYARELYKEK